MYSYLGTLKNISELSLDKLLVIDRFKWTEKADLSVVIPEVWRIVKENLGHEELCNYLSTFMSTPLQKRNLELVIKPAYRALCQKLSEMLMKGPF
jgi:hypothetical protein